MSKDSQERVSRNEEIRAIFIFGLLAVFASIRVQYQTLMLTYQYGKFDLIPFINELIIFWSLYAFFMVLGLSPDSLGKSLANAFRNLSNLFLQYSYVILGIFIIPFGFVIYGMRLFFALFMIMITLTGAIYIEIRRKTKQSNMQVNPMQSLKSIKLRNNSPKILVLALLVSVTLICNYPESGFVSTVVVWAAFVIGVISILFILKYLKKEQEIEDNSKDDYYF